MRLLLIRAQAESTTAETFLQELPSAEAFDFSIADERGDVPIGEDYRAVVLLWSEALMPFGTKLEQAVLDAWEDDRLVLITLDTSELPLGLRDLPVIDAGRRDRQRFKLALIGQLLRQARMIGFAKGFGDHIRRHLDTIAHAQAPPAATSAEAPMPRELVSKSSEWPETAWRYLLAMVTGIARAVSFLWRRAERRSPGPLKGILLEDENTTVAEPFLRHQDVAYSLDRNEHPDLFVSYARADLAIVDQILAAIAAAGGQVWIDREAIRSGQNWAGEIVRAIKDSRAVLVMCSPRAFQSDHVKREVYLADKYKKPIMPIFVEAAEPSDDFDYFLAGVQRFEWYRLAQQDRRAAVTAALATL